MRHLKNISIFLLAAALWPAAVSAQLGTVTVTDPPLANGSTVFMMNTGLWQTDEWSLENNIARSTVTGELYVTGTFWDTDSNSSKIFVRKISRAGAEVWTSTITNPVNPGSSDYGRGVALSPDGSAVYALGVMQLATQDIVVAKYDAATGAELWAGTYVAYDSGDHSDNAYDIVADAAYAYVAGTKANDIAIIRFPAGGGAPLATSFDGGTSYNVAYSIHIRDNVLAVAGSIYDEVNWNNEIWVARYSTGATLTHVWASTYTSVMGSDEAHAVKIAPNYNIYAAGYRYNYDSGQDIWLGKYDANGNLLYFRTKNGLSNGWDMGFGLALDNFENVYVTGKMDAYSQGQATNLWLGKYSSAGELLSEVSLHSGHDAGYDVEVSSWMVYVGGAFDSNYGIAQVYPEQFGTPPDLFAGPGWYAGSVNLNWVPEAAAIDYRIQVATYAAFPWDAGNAAPAYAYIEDSWTGTAGSTLQREIKGLPVRIDHTSQTQAPGPDYYFKVWTSPASEGTWTPLNTVARSAPYSPYNYWNYSQRGQDEFRVFNSASASSAASARDADGNTYVAFGLDMGGAVIVKFGPYGEARWTSFYSYEDASESGRVEVRRLEAGPAGGLYAVGTMADGYAGDEDAWIARFDPLGLKIWDKVVGDPEGDDAFNALAMDGAGKVYAAGHLDPGGSGRELFIAKFEPAPSAGGDAVMLDTHTHTMTGAAAPSAVWGLAVDGSNNVYAGGYSTYLGGTASDRDAVIVRFNASLDPLAEARYQNPPLDAEFTGTAGDAIYDLAVSGAQLYAAGSRYTHGAGVNYSNFWLASIGASDLAQDWSTTYNSPENLEAGARGLALGGGYLYAAGYETRTGSGGPQQNIVLQKYDVENLGSGPAWVRSVDGSYFEESVRGLGVDAGGDGYFYVPALFNAWEDQQNGVVNGYPGVARVSEPRSGLAAQPGYKPGSVSLSWITEAELPAGTTVYVHHSTVTPFDFNANAARVFSFYTDYTLFTGDYLQRLVPGLDAGLGSSGIDSPVHHFKIGYKRPGEETITAVAASTAAVPNTPGVWDRMSNYANGNFFLINGAHGGHNPLLRDAGGNIYTAGTVNPWGSFYAAYVRKFGPDGRPVWTRFYADQYEYSQPVIHALALDSDGNLYAGGSAGSESWSGQPPYGPESATGKDGLLIKYGPDGRMHWARTYDFENAGGNDEIYSLAAGPDYLYAAGYRYNEAQEGRHEDGVIYALSYAGAPTQYSHVSALAGSDMFYSLSYDTAGGRLYAGGRTYGSDYDGLVKTFSPTLVDQETDINLDGGGDDAVYAVKADPENAALYVAGSLDDGGPNRDAWLARYSTGTPLVQVWAETYNSANQNTDEATGLALDGLGGVYLSGSEYRYDINQGKNVFVRKYNDAGDLIWSQTFNSGGYTDDAAGGLAVDPAGGVYAAVDAGYVMAGATFGDALNGAGYFKHVQFNMNVVNPRLTVIISSGTGDGAVLPGVSVAVMGFSQTGGIDPNGIRMSVTGAEGKHTFSLPGGKSYFIAVSSHNMVPTIKDQLSDPNGNFFVDLNADTTKQYYISRRQPAADPVHRMLISFSTHTGTLAPGDFVMGEVYINQTGERVGYSVVKLDTDPLLESGSIAIENLPAAADGVYGMAVSVPARNKVAQLFMTGPFPSTYSYTADMSQASQLTGSFEVGGSTVPPSVAGMVMTEQWSSIAGARVRLERYSCSQWTGVSPDRYCSGTWSRVYDKETFSDAGGSFAFYNVPFTDPAYPEDTYNLNVGKAGYASGYDRFSLLEPPPGMPPMPYMQQFQLQVATYTLTGVLRYNGVPLPNATIMVFPDHESYPVGADSYRQGEWGGSAGIRTDARVRTAADGTFTVNGLTDGNARIDAAFEGGWRSLNEGNSWETRADNVRVTISSQGATAPLNAAVNGCLPGRVWTVDYSSGTCRRAGPVAFNIIPTGGNTAGRVRGDVTFVTTYTVTASNPLVISTSSPLTIMAQQRCDGGDCGNQQMGFTSLAGTFTGNTTSYSITLSTGFTYYPKIFSTAWAKATSFDSEIDLASTDTFRYDMSVLRSGGLKGVLKLPDGTNFRPSWGDEISTSTYMADIEIRGLNVDVGDGRNVDEYGEFEFPNLAPGNYRISIRPRGLGFVWAPAVLENVAVVEGKTTEVKLQLEAGLAVRPSIANLPEVSTSSWRYVVISVPSGTEMNQKTVTELFFSKTEYGFEYSTSTGWATQYMAPGQYDFYLLLASRYDPCDYGGDCVPSYSQFGNFIGRLKGKAIQKNPDQPTLGSTANPIPIEILGGAVGQAGIAGTVAGSNIFTDADYDRIFSNFEQMFELIPAVMLYDSAGDLKGFANAMPGDEASFMAFMTAMRNQDRAAMRALFAAYPMTYGVWRLPPGRYTVVFNNPNYPPVAKEVLDITAPGSDVTAFNFDNEEIVTAAISGVVRSSTTLEPLAGARVYLKHRTVEKFTMTDSSGAFSFANLPTGIFRLEVMRNGYVTAGAKTGLSADENETFALYMLPSSSKITGRIYMSKFPTQVTKAGVTVVAYDETDNVNNPAAYLPKTEVQTDASGNFEIPGVVPGHLYKLSAFYTGKMPALADVTAREGVTVVGDITLKDIPPQISIKVRKSPDSVNKVDVVIRSPKSLMTTPSCEYSPGETLDEASAVTLTLVSGPNRTYLTSFTVSSSQRYYTVKVTAGDAGNKMEKFFVYDQVSNAKTEQYIQEESLAGGSVQMDKETEDYSGIELDPGALSYSTATSGTVDYANLVGGFFSALPSVRTVKTAKGDLTISEAVKSLMASEVYNLDLSNASANKPFTLTLKYDKERGAAHTRTMRIYQQDGNGNWNEVPGDYTIDPMLGLASVEVGGLTDATQGAAAAFTPLGRKRMGMSSVVNGRYVPSATPAPQSGRFAVMTAPPTTGKDAYSGAFEIFNLPNPFDLNSKNVTLGADALASAGNYTTTGTVLKFNLPSGKGGNVKFVIYNLAGEKVRTLDMGSLAGGKMYYSEWDGRNDKNEECASGVYFLLPFVNGEKLTGKAHKMAIIK
ncbi:MAG: carboxypeptidase regulatory-like domain-containing protein [Elusimicrobiales bacterium]|nr:carboxypeptidase regulatory-like domain-containing protein [Elusimicrobiales bacterium]